GCGRRRCAAPRVSESGSPMKPLKLVLLSCAVSGVLLAQAPVAVNPDAAIVQDFQKRVADYQKLHKTLEAKQPRLKRTPSQEKIEHHEKELAHQIREARRGGGQGEIFFWAKNHPFARR